MEPFVLLRRWGGHLRDPARWTAFARFAVRRLLEDRVFEAAGALAYTTVFAVVPLSMVALGVLSAFPVFEQWRDALTGYVFANFVPSAAHKVSDYLTEFTASTKSLTAAGAVALIVSLLVTLGSIEAVFNRIWRVPSARPRLGRFLVYWTVLTLGSLMAAASLALSTRFFALAVFETLPGRWLEAVLLRLAPVVIELLAIAALFKVVPHRSVAWRHALAGALLSMLLFELIKWGLGLYLDSFDSYQKIYGAVAFVPIFMLWIYLSWVSVLVGASFASALSAFRYLPAAQRLPEGQELYGLLRLLGRLYQARRQGRGLHVGQVQALEPGLTDALIQQFLQRLARAGVVVRAEDGQWLLARDLEHYGLDALYAAAGLRLPLEAGTPPPGADDPLGRAVLATLDDLRQPLRERLRRPVAAIYQGLPDP
ncbi:YihY family inner membrane protein [Thermomonas flagellata]|uniref:YihY family inner membrane protein n=1 Tax=Thermomonas flagellata TaxID=2888524 RepID=UPI001F043CEF|nr:YihY family inner membrane protein [Thermomonas flagellata]